MTKYDKKQVEALREIIKEWDDEFLGSSGLLESIDKDAKEEGLGGQLKDLDTLRFLVTDMYLQMINDILEKDKSIPPSKLEKDNGRRWHVDLIELLTSFDLSDSIQRKQCFNYRNTRPIWDDDNPNYEKHYTLLTTQNNMI